VAEGWSLRRLMPRGLFSRALIIIVTPIVLLQAIIAYVFFERDLDSTTRRLARDVAADIALLVAQEDTYRGIEREKLRALSARQLDYRIQLIPGKNLPPFHGQPVATIDVALDDILEQRIGADRDFRTARIGDEFDIQVDVHDGVLSVLVPRDRVTVSKPDIFILWMVASSLLLMGIAIIFLRNQVRPIERLARAADSFGKGRAVPDFKPYGATEVRRAAQAFITMRERIERHVAQRTEMLAGVSHDIKTPLTRMKLTLAMMPDDADVSSMRGDIGEMEHMLDDYLAFARGRRRRGCQPHRSQRLGARCGVSGRTGKTNRTGQRFGSSACSRQRQARRRAPGAGQPDRQCPQAWQQGRREPNSGRAAGGNRRRRQWPGHSRAPAGRGLPSVPPPGRGPQSAKRRLGAGAGHRPRHRPRPWR
jgi:two-component system osmolarity sensor histidine kinase EnvZ